MLKLNLKNISHEAHALIQARRHETSKMLGFVHKLCCFKTFSPFSSLRFRLGSPCSSTNHCELNGAFPAVLKKILQTGRKEKKIFFTMSLTFFFQAEEAALRE